MTNLSEKSLLIVLVCFSLTAGQNLNYRQLRQLYNTRVRYAQLYTRQMGSSSGINFPSWIPHAGVVVTTVDGGRWLVHKGKGYGIESQTVVTQAYNMGRSWRPGIRKSVRRSTVGDYVAAGGGHYNLLGDNCLHSAGRMMRLN